MRKKIAVGLLAVGLLAVVANAVASSFKVRVRAGNLVLDAQGGFEPKALPKFVNAPITTHGGGKLSTTSGDLPPILDKFILEFDKHGALDTTGLPFCTTRKLIATDRRRRPPRLWRRDRRQGVRQGRRQVPRTGADRRRLPDHPLQRPEEGRDDTIIAHAHLDYPGPTTFIVPIVIEKINKGVYGYRVNVKIPKIAGGYGHPISGHAKVGHKWTYKGKKHSYINARCETGHFQVSGEFTFKEGPEESATALADVDQILKANFFLPCDVRK